MNKISEALSKTGKMQVIVFDELFWNNPDLSQMKRQPNVDIVFLCKHVPGDDVLRPPTERGMHLHTLTKSYSQENASSHSDTWQHMLTMAPYLGQRGW